MDPLDLNPQPNPAVNPNAMQQTVGQNLVQSLADPNLGRDAQSLSATPSGQWAAPNEPDPNAPFVPQQQPNQIPQQQPGQPDPLHLMQLQLQQQEYQAGQAIAANDTHNITPAPPQLAGNPPGLNAPVENYQMPAQMPQQAPNQPPMPDISTPATLKAPAIDESLHAKMAKDPAAMTDYMTKLMQETAAQTTQANMQQMIPMMNQMQAAAAKRNGLLQGFYDRNQEFLQGGVQMQNVPIQALEEANRALPMGSDMDKIVLAEANLAQTKQMLQQINAAQQQTRTHDLRNRQTFQPVNNQTRQPGQMQPIPQDPNQVMMQDMINMQTGNFGGRTPSGQKFLNEIGVD